MSGAALRRPSALPQSELVRLSDLSGPVALGLSPQRRALLLGVLNGWRIERWQREAPDPLLSIAEVDNAYVVGGRAASQPLQRSDFSDAVCGFLAELVRIYADDNPSRLCLHAASAVFGDRLVVFPSTFRAGKSTLCAALAAAGIRIGGDDVLLIDAAARCGEALGFPPRLRRPLPDNLAPDSVSFIDRHAQLRGRQYQYLDLSPAALLRKGDKLPIGGLVFLDRRSEGEAALAPVQKSDALQTLLHQNFARAVPPRGILECLTDIVERAAIFRLAYSRAEEAVRLLESHFAVCGGRSKGGARRPARRVLREQAPPETAGPGQIRRRAGIAQHEFDGQTFLAVEESGRILSLNSTASALWRALEEPATDAELKELMALAFPDLPDATLAMDVDAALGKLSEEGLIVRP